jgi:hypothetical protein
MHRPRASGDEPASGAGDGPEAGSRNYFDFTNDLLSRLDGNGFYNVAPYGSVTAPTNVCIWTHHNYADITYDHGVNTTALDKGSYQKTAAQYDRFHLRSAWVRALLVNRWRGYPSGDASNPRMFLTEGGARKEAVASAWHTSDAQFPAMQSTLVARNLIRLSDDTPTGGAGVDMMTNYLLISTTSWDTGMVDEASLAARPLYTNTWKPYPGRA